MEENILLDEKIKNIYWNENTINYLKQKWLNSNKLVILKYWYNTYMNLEDNRLLIEYMYK